MVGRERAKHIVRAIAFTWLVVFLVGLSIDAAPQLVCYTVGPGDTAAMLAFRLTGDVRNARASLFQVFDPTTAAWVPKVSYSVLQPGWRACVPYARYTPPRDPSQLRALDWLANTLSAVGWWWVPLVMSASAFLLNILGARADRDRATAMELETFGKAFIREFERPLLESSAHDSDRRPPLRSRLSATPRSGRLEIFLAPGAGRRYPNLVDHRKNVEYDIDRVMTVLGDGRFELGDLAEEDQWIVIPFRKAG
jgi:hypothetical protein